MLFFTFVRNKQPQATERNSRVVNESFELTAPLMAVALMYFCLKMIRYSFLFWLPL